MSFNQEARRRFLSFAISSGASWPGSFRDLNASVIRMATLAPGGRITLETAEHEINRLQAAWRTKPSVDPNDLLATFLSAKQIDNLDAFDQAQLLYVIEICRQSKTIAEAGRKLFQASRQKRATTNDSDRIRKYLARFGLDWQQIVA